MYNFQRRNNLNKFFKINYFFYIISVSFLLYQSIDLFIEFMSGKTVNNISVGNIRNTSLPAVTLCPCSLDFGKLSFSNKNVSILYKKYLKMIEKANRSRSVLHGNLDDLYDKALEIYFNWNEQNINIKDHIINNLTPLINKMNETMLSSIFYRSSAYGPIDKDLNQFEAERDLNYIMKSLPIESLIITVTGNIPQIFKCYSLFSHSESSWNNTKMVFHRFIIALQLDASSSPITPSMNIQMVIHSPNTMSIEGYSYVNPGYIYIIKYSKWNIIRLGKGYDTDCREYDPKKYTRNDCIFDCYQEKAKYHCQTEDFVSSYIIKGKKYFEKSNLNLSKCFIKNEIRHEIIEFCYKQCNLECDINYYSFTIDKIQEIEFYKNYFSFEPSYMPDLTIRHIPEMPLLTFICNFGGILGMWLGVSFVDILNRLWNLIRLKILIWFNMNITNNHIFINRMIRHH